MNMLPSLPPHWRRWFDPTVLNRGLILYKAGTVKSVYMEQDLYDENPCIVAEISMGRGNVGELFFFVDKLFMNGKSVVGFCDFCEEDDCLHLAATLMACEDQGVLAKGNSGFADFESNIRPVSDDQKFDYWIDSLEQAISKNKKGGGASSKEVLLYSLSFPAEVGAGEMVWLETLKSRYLKSGGLGAKSPYAIVKALAANPARFIQPVDIKLARLLFLINEDDARRGCRYVLNARQTGTDDFLECLIETGRLFLEDDFTQPLKAGPPVQGQLQWRLMDNGDTVSSIELGDPNRLLYVLNPLWYVDVDQKILGRVQMDLPDGFLDHWIHLPPFNRIEAQVMKEKLERVPELKTILPEISVPEIKNLPNQPAKPHLTLSTHNMLRWEVHHLFPDLDSSNNVEVLFAELQFLYHDVLIDPKGVPHEEIEMSKDGNLIRFTRDFKSELEAFKTLESLGFILYQSSTIFGTPNRFNMLMAWASADWNKWFKLVNEELSRLEEEGWILNKDDDLHYELTVPDSYTATLIPDTRNQWFQVDLGVDIKGEKIDLLPVILNALQSQQVRKVIESQDDEHESVPIQLPDGRFIAFPKDRLKSILSVLTELYHPELASGTKQLKVNRFRAAELTSRSDEQGLEWKGGESIRNLAETLKKTNGIPTVKPSKALKAELRHYQADGLSWLQWLRQGELGGILADDMGLGKTIQTLAHIQLEHEKGTLKGPCLIVTPTSVLHNWIQEAQRFTPGLKFLKHHGVDRKDQMDRFQDYQLIITTYPLLPRDSKHLIATQFDMVILDEAQYIKNPRALWTETVCALNAHQKICLTGTPMENHLGELWSLFNFLMPGFFWDEGRFRTIFRNPIEKEGNSERQRILQHRIKPFVMRRKKEDVAQDLPPKTVMVNKIEIEGKQRDLYESIRLAMHARVKSEIKKKGVSRSHIIILDALLKLRQVCCDPSLLKIPEAAKVRQSAKLEMLMRVLPDMIEEGRRILLFSQFTSMLDIIETRLSRLNPPIPWTKITGQTTNRMKAIDQFQNGDVPLFLISLKAGGTGLNLTTADTVIHYDPWWNPAVEDQATDRAHRIGQQKKVFVYKYITVGTVEERILSLQEKKKELVQNLLEGTSKGLNITAKDVDYLFAPLE